MTLQKLLNACCFALALAAALPRPAGAFSGAGGECGNGALQTAASDGSPAELEKAIDVAVRALEKVVAQWDDNIARLFPETAEVWRSRAMRKASAAEKRRVFAGWWEGCRSLKLLDAAVAGRNMANVEYLLALGVDAEARARNGSTVLMRCPHRREAAGWIFTDSAPPARDRAAADAVQAIYARLVRQGASMSRRDPLDHLGPLHRCNDPAAIEAFIASGADFTAGGDPAGRGDENAPRVIDYRTIALLGNVIPPEREPYLAILERLLQHTGERRIAARTERLIAEACGKPANQATCARLATRLTARDDTIFRPKPQGASQ